MRGISLRNALLLVAAVIAVGWWFDGSRAVPRAPGVLAPTEPRQDSVPAGTPVREKDGFTITPLASFALDARVLSREDYSFDAGAAISPTDLALGWGPMSDSSVLAHLRISQGNRWWYWRADELPLDSGEIQASAANMHMIPANAAVASALGRVRAGDLVALRGQLVEVVRKDNGWRWKSSLSRTDTGNGACELVWVEDLRVR